MAGEGMGGGNVGKKIRQSKGDRRCKGVAVINERKREGDTSQGETEEGRQGWRKRGEQERKGKEN